MMPDSHSVLRHFAIALALTASTGAIAQSWKEIVRGANSTAYADTGSIERRDVLATMQVLIDYQKPPFDGNNLPYRSLTMRNEYHCGEGRMRVLSIASHTANMGSGERPYTTDEASEWEAVTNASIQRDLWKLACNKDKLPPPIPVQPSAATPQPEQR